MPYKRVVEFLSRGSKRSVKAKTNILFSFFLKGISILIGLIIVPVTLNYLGVEEYGIWLTLSSILLWLGYFDIGLGNGLRNKLTESFARNDDNLARIYVSTTYAGIILIFTGVLLIFLIINPFLNWTQILNTSPSLVLELNQLVIVVVIFLIIRFMVQLISTIIIADQNPSISGSFDVIANIISLGFIFILKAISLKSLLYLGIIFSASPVLVYIIASIIFFKGKYKFIRPSIHFVKFKYFKELGGLGVKFLFIQLAFLIIFSTNNFLISYLFGPQQVTIYNIAYKYFINLFFLFNIILIPFWSAFTDAYVQKDFLWIRNTLKKLILIWVVLIILIILMLIFSDYLYRLWVGNVVKIPFMLSVLIGLFVAIYAWFNIFCFFINGTGKITLQLVVYIIAALLDIPLILFFTKYLHLSLNGVILANIIAMIPIAIFMPIQTLEL
jgi:O-antigen/teichoic acid export membrane protein